MSQQMTYSEAAELEAYIRELDEYQQFLEEIDEEDFLGRLEYD